MFQDHVILAAREYLVLVMAVETEFAPVTRLAFGKQPARTGVDGARRAAASASRSTDIALGDDTAVQTSVDACGAKALTIASTCLSAITPTIIGNGRAYTS